MPYPNLLVKEKAYKVKKKTLKNGVLFDRRAKPRELEIGSMVLMNVPGLVAKLEDAWNEPFEMIAKLSPMTYLLAIPRRCTFCFSFCNSN